MPQANAKGAKKRVHGPWQMRFWRHVDTSGEGDTCWEWLGYKGTWGYGELNVGGKAVSAHRLSYELHYGPIPAGMKVCHTCDNPGCVRPDHLFAGTDADNHKDRNAKGRQARGEQHGRSKLTVLQVKDIKRRLRLGERRVDLAREHGVDTAAIRLIDIGKNWKHV